MHVVHRGNNRARIFFEEHEYRLYLTHLSEEAASVKCDVHAYVLMPNHVHVLLTPREEMAASRMMKALAQKHAQFINRFHRRTGGLWEGRFRSSVVEDGSYLFNCYRYIELNPVRAGMVTDPARYPWSSYRANAHGEFSDLITPHSQFLRLGDSDEERRCAYRRLFEASLGNETIEEIRKSGQGCLPLGSDAFRRRWLPSRGRTPGTDPGDRPPGQTPGSDPD